MFKVFTALCALKHTDRSKGLKAEIIANCIAVNCENYARSRTMSIRQPLVHLSVGEESPCEIKKKQGRIQQHFKTRSKTQGRKLHPNQTWSYRE